MTYKKYKHRRGSNIKQQSKGLWWVWTEFNRPKGSFMKDFLENNKPSDFDNNYNFQSCVLLSCWWMIFVNENLASARVKTSRNGGLGTFRRRSYAQYMCAAEAVNSMAFV
jgi:hypothetical protein